MTGGCLCLHRPVFEPRDNPGVPGLRLRQPSGNTIVCIICRRAVSGEPRRTAV